MVLGKMKKRNKILENHESNMKHFLFGLLLGIVIACFIFYLISIDNTSRNIINCNEKTNNSCDFVSCYKEFNRNVPIEKRLDCIEYRLRDDKE